MGTRLTDLQRAAGRLAAFGLLCALTMGAPLGCRRLPPPTPPPAPTATRTSAATLPATAIPSTTVTAVVAPSASPSVVPTPSLPAHPQLLAPYRLDAPPAPGVAAEDVVVLGERVYVCNRASDNVSVIAEGHVTAVVEVGQSPSALAAHVSSGQVFVLNEMDGTISVLIGDEVQATWTPEVPPSTLAVVGDELWVGSQRGDRVQVLDVRDGRRVGEVALSGASAVFTLASHSASGRVYAATYGRVHALDARTLTELGTVDLASYRTLGVSPDGERLYVGVWGADAQRAALQVLDAQTLQELGSIELVGDPSDVLANPRDGRVYVLASYPDALWIVDPLTRTAMQRPGLGLRASAGALSDDGSRLYVCHRESDSLVVVDTVTLAVSATVPLTLCVNDLAVEGESGAVYAAVGPADRVYRLAEGQAAQPWSVAGYPYRVAALPDAELAILSRVDGRLRVLAVDGAERYSLPLGDYPSDLAFELAADTLYAGGTVLSLNSLFTATLRVPTLYGGEEIPSRIVRDSRRERLYAVAFNGVPGSNGGNTVTRLGAQGAEITASAPGRLSVIDLLYDEEGDRFYSTNARMGTFGLQVSAGEDCRELLYLPLAGYPAALAVNRTTHHLWLAVQSGYATDGRTTTEMIAWDTRSLGEAARLRIDGAVTCMAVDEARMRVYLGGADAGQVYVVQDVPLPQPPAPTATQTSTPWPTSTATPQPSATVTARPTVIPSATPPPVPTRSCTVAVDERLADIWRASAGAEWLGCPVEAAREVLWAVQPFERGWMLWRSDTPSVFVLGDDGGWSGYADNWREGQPAESCTGTPPEGVFKPQRGFGLVWCEQAGVTERLGWATENERAVVAVYQACERGLLLRDDAGVSYALGDDHTWTRVAP